MFAQSQPHAAYSALLHGVIGRWTYAARSNDRLAECIEPLESAIQSKLISALTGLLPPRETIRSLFALPACFGGMGIIDKKTLSAEYDYSLKVTEPLTSLILQQQLELRDTAQRQTSIKSDVQQLKRQATKTKADLVTSRLQADMKHAVDLAQEKGASMWLTVLPLQQHGFSLCKSEFCDALCLRYGWCPPYLADFCPCGEKFTIGHSLSCPTGGFPIIRHNELRDVFAAMLSAVCHDVEVEPILQPLSGEIVPQESNTKEDEACIDISACGLWGGHFRQSF